jgi:hypothetical protein
VSQDEDLDGVSAAPPRSAPPPPPLCGATVLPARIVRRTAFDHSWLYPLVYPVWVPLPRGVRPYPVPVRVPACVHKRVHERVFRNVPVL